MNQQFNPVLFAELVKRSVGNTKNKEFASSIGVTPEYFSRITNARLANPPSIKKIQEIASHATNGVTYSELMIAAGYATPSDNVLENISDLSEDDQKFMQGTILTALSSIGIPCTMEQKNKDTDYNLSVSFKSGAFTHWHFYFLNNMNEDLISKCFNNLYSHLIFDKISQTEKISFVTSNQDEYNYYLNMLPINLDLNLSIILIDEKKLVIQSETWLHSITSISKENLSIYTL